MDGFLAFYTKITKDDIRRNRDNAAERLGFLGKPRFSIIALATLFSHRRSCCKPLQKLQSSPRLR